MALPLARPQPIPGFIEITEVLFNDTDDYYWLGGPPPPLPDDDTDVRERFLTTRPRLFALSQVMDTAHHYAYGQTFGQVCDVVTLENHDELVARIAAAAGALRTPDVFE